MLIYVADVKQNIFLSNNSPHLKSITHNYANNVIMSVILRLYITVNLLFIYYCDEINIQNTCYMKYR